MITSTVGLYGKSITAKLEGLEDKDRKESNHPKENARPVLSTDPWNVAVTADRRDNRWHETDNRTDGYGT